MTFSSENIIISKANRNFSLVTVLPKIILEFTIVCLILIFIAYNLKIKTELNVILPTMGVFFAAAFRLMPSFNKIFNNIQLIRFGRSTSQNLYKELSSLTIIELR